MCPPEILNRETGWRAEGSWAAAICSACVFTTFRVSGWLLLGYEKAEQGRLSAQRQTLSP